MADWSDEAWVTSVVTNDAVTNALVLAKSIQKSNTTRKLVGITSQQVSIENRHLLSQAFDMVLLLDNFLNVDNDFKNLSKMENILAKAYTFALVSFKRCVYVEANSLVLENADIVFEKCGKSQFLANSCEGLLDLSCFVLKPCKVIWNKFCQSVSVSTQDCMEDYLSKWLENNLASGSGIGKLPDGIMAKFNISTGTLLTDQLATPIIRLIGEPEMESVLSRLKLLHATANTGIREKLVAQVWLDVHNEIISQDFLELSKVPSRGWEGYANEPIAIVGMSCRYPGANNLEEFWNLLFAGEEALGEPSAFRWTKEHTLKVTPQDRKVQAGFLKVPVDEFDAGFFGVSPKEAQYMDPQTRLLHEVMWESLEDAGVNPHSLCGSNTGIFTGSWMNDYKEIVQGSAEKDFFRTYMGNGIGAAAARLSHLLGLTGPSIATESGCSSSIVALDLAIKSLRKGETHLAIAGGVNLLLNPFTKNLMEFVLSPNFRCKTFDASADGFARAEGCGVLVLKRLSDAMRDRDNIWAVIRGSAISQEGLSRSLGTPTVHCEALAMKLALEDAGVHPEQVSFVETHGTGTAVGDPMEISAIAKAYYSPNRMTPLVLGSVKTNVGHTESCSGITGIMKAVLAMQHELIPKHRNLETLNPEIFLDTIPAMIPMQNLPWSKVKGHPRICGVSSFGITGTDGHVIIEEAPEYELPKFSFHMERSVHLMTISGKSSDALEELLREYENLFCIYSEKGESSFADVAYTANVGRAKFDNRAFVVAGSYQEALKAFQDNRIIRGEVVSGSRTQICFLFTGQGSQYSGMAKILYDTSPVFRITFDACNRTLQESYNLSIREVLWDSGPNSKELSRTIYSQTSIFCVEYCLLKLWQSWGIKPDYVLGHSLGEFCAAVAAGVLTFENALKLVAERSRLIDNLPRGSMLVIKASKPEVEKWMKSFKIDLDFAALNSPEQTVVAGDTKTIESFMSYLKSQGTKAIILEATHAFHSRHMDSMLEEYRKVAESIKYRQGNPNIQYVSGMEGGLIDDVTKLGPDYWVRHTREKVSFLEACAVLRDLGCQDFLEIGPQPVLSSFVLSNIEDVPLNCLPSLRKGTNDWETILTSLGKLYLLGYQIDWRGYDEPYTRIKMSLPFHPFNRKSLWVECSSNTASIIHPLLGSQINNASALSIFQNDLKPKSVPYLKDHCIGNRIIFPGAGFTEMCLSAGYCTANGFTENLEPPTQALRLANLRIDAPLELKEDKVCHLQAIVDLPEDSTETSGYRVKIFHQNTLSSDESGKWVLHASANFVPVASTKDCLKNWSSTRIQDIIAKNEQRSTKDFYKCVDDAGLKFGDTFRSLLKYWTVKLKDRDEVVAEMPVPMDNQKYLLHPLIIDAAFQMGFVAVQSYAPSRLKVPVTLESLTLFPGGIPDNTESLYLHLRSSENGKVVLFICAKESLTPVACLENFELMDTTVATIESVLEQQSSPIPDVWEEIWKPIPGPFDSHVAQNKEFETLHFEPEFSLEVTALGQNSQLEKALHGEMKRLTYLYILNACQQLGWKPEVGQTTDVVSFCSTLGIREQHRKLIRFYLTVFEEDAELLSYLGEGQWVVQRAPPDNFEVTYEMDQLFKELKGSETYAEVVNIFENVAKNLSDILRGQKSALQLLFPESESDFRYSADAFYQCHPRKEKLLDTVKVLMNAQFQKSQAMDIEQNGGQGVYRVLEVGSGTGSLSGPMLTWLKDVWGNRFEMWYTDISKGFFAKAEQKFKDFRENMKFEVFNLEQSPLSQGIPLGYFDMVCATDVLHATRDLEETLVHLRQTLRPGGVICFTETVEPVRDFTFVFGLLEGYWRYEDSDWRTNHCCVGKEVWGQVLEKCGYRDFNCFKVFMDEFACMIAMAEPQLKVETLVPTGSGVMEGKPTWLLFVESESAEVGVKIANMVVASGNRVVLGFRGNMASFAKTDFRQEVSVETFALEEDAQIECLLGGSNVQGVIYAWGMNANEKNQENVALPFLHIAKIMVALEKPPKLFVVTQGVHPVTEDGVTGNASAATLFGMAKSLKNERFDLSVRCVELGQGASVEEHLSQVLFELAMHKGAAEQHRLQVAYRGGHRYEPRLCKASLPMAKDELKLPPSTDRYHLRLPASRMIQDLEFEPLEVETVGETEVEIRTKAYALNFKDILTILKPSAEFDKLNAVGLDFAGVVTKAGEKAKWKVGDRVFGSNFKEAQLPSHLVLESEMVVGIPDSMTFTEAATLPAVFLTAYYCLMNVAKMKMGDKVLIHTGSGGVGLAAIQVAKMVGAEIITTAGTSRKRAYLKSLGIQHVFKSRDTSYEQDILRVTNGKGVDIVLNSITGPGIKEATLTATAKNGRFVEMSKLNVWTPEEVQALRPDVDYSIVDLTTVDQGVQTDLLRRLYHFLIEEKIKPIPFVKFDALRIRQALQYFQKAKHIGKVVVTIPEVSTSLGQFKTEVSLFNSQSTYIITGGLGGIGFEVCKWMLSKGATDIVLIGRRPPAPEITMQVYKLQADGFNVHVKLSDIGRPDQCQVLIDEIMNKGKPLRGVMHCAGVLRDNLYSSQTWSRFEATFNPKVNGTWNLHESTKNLPLEHFVVYSSVTALIGTPGQPNHAAANCFEDAFIHYRHSLGLPGLSVNWGQWAQVGCAKELSSQSFVPVSVSRMLNGLELALRQEKRQVAFIDFASINNLTTFCPTTRYYLDDKVIKKLGTEDACQVPEAGTFWVEMDKAVSQMEKIGVLTGYLKKILCAALRVDKDQKLSDKANLQELGVDSLMMIELKNSIQSLLGSRANVTANLLKNCATIEQISEAVVSRFSEGQNNQEDLSLEPLDPVALLELLRNDAQLPEMIQVAPGTKPAVKANQIKTVLVTGATGKLGAYLVAKICKFVDRVLCLVRGTPDDKSALEKVRKHFQKLELEGSVTWSKIEGVAGNVTMENLGIQVKRYMELCQNVDAVIHCAGKTSLVEHLRQGSKDGEDIRSVNILGTGNILKFACSEKVKHVFYPSSIFCGILSQTENSRLSDEWPEVGVIQTIVDHQLPGLFASKWVGELLMKQANERGIPAKTCRFPVLAGHSKTGRMNAEKNLNVQRFLKFLKLGAIPNVAVPATALPVDICAKVALKLFINGDVPHEVFNVTHSKPQMEQEFVQVAHEKFGRTLEILSWSKFVERLRDSKLTDDMYQDEAVFSKWYTEVFQMATSYAQNSETYFRNDKVEKYISGYDKDFSSSMETIARDLEFVRSNELMKNFQF